MDIMALGASKTYTDSLKVSLTNHITNGGDFSQGVLPWKSSASVANVLSIEDGYLRSTAIAKAYVGQFGNWKVPAGTKFFIKFNARASKAGDINVGLAKNSDFSVIDSNATISITTVDTSYAFFLTSGANIVGGIRFSGTDFTTNGDYIEIKNIIVTPLDNLFGTDLEFSTKEIEDILVNYDISPYFEGKTELAGNFQDLIYFMQKTQSVFSVDFETASIGSTIATKFQKSLSLIAIKSVNYYHADNLPIQQPTAVGYLYLDEDTDKLYYSSGVYNHPEYLCDWDSTLTGGLACKYYQATITNDGDIIFLKIRARGNPIIYPAGDYANPVVIDFGENNAPAAGVTDSAICHHYSGDYFVFGEYFNPSTSGDPIYIWKVSKPYGNVASWVKVDEWIQRLPTDGEGSNPTREIAHFHMVQFDFYSGQWIASTGDLNYQCRILVSYNDAATWAQVANTGQSSRMLGMVFTEDAAYWGTDSPELHRLCKVERDESGELDFANIITVSSLYFDGTLKQPTYATCLMRNPYGLLFLDRAEPRADLKLNLDFWDLTEQKLYTLGVYDRIEGNTGEDSTRHGFGNQVVTQYQSVFEDGIICGCTTNPYSRVNSIDVLNNTLTNRVGNLKIKISKSKGLV